MSMMFFADEAEAPLPPREVRILEAAVQTAPNDRRVALHILLTPFLEYPNLEITLLRPDGSEERSLSVIGAMERRLTLTLHVAQPESNGLYTVRLELQHEGETLQTQTVSFSMPATG